MSALHEEPPGRAIRLQVHPGDQAVAEQEGQHVVAVQPLVRRRVDLDPVAHAEQALGPRTVPDQRVERRQQRSRADPPRVPGCRIKVGRLAPSLDAHGGDLARLHQLGDAGLGVIRREAKVVPQIARRRDPERASGDAQELAVGVWLAGRRPVEDDAGQHTPSQIIDPLEAGAPGGGRDPPRPEQPLQRALGVAPAPPAALTLGPFQVGCGERPLGRNALQDGLGLRAAFAREGLQPAPGPLPPLGAGHAPAQPWMQLQRQQRGLVSPVLEQRLPGPPGGLLQQGARIVAEPRIERQVVRSGQDVDRVDLEQGRALQHPVQVAEVRRASGSRVAEALRRQCNAPGFGERQGVRHGPADAALRPLQQAVLPRAYGSRPAALSAS